MNYSLRDALNGVIKTELMEKAVMMAYQDSGGPAKPYRLPEDSVHLLDAAIELYNSWIKEKIDDPAMRGAAAVVAAHTIARNDWCNYPCTCTVEGVLIWIED